MSPLLKHNGPQHLNLGETRAAARSPALADHPATHRKRGTESQWLASVRDAYGNESLVCQMWEVFRRRAVKAGYQPFGGAKCDR